MLSVCVSVHDWLRPVVFVCDVLLEYPCAPLQLLPCLLLTPPEPVPTPHDPPLVKVDDEPDVIPLETLDDVPCVLALEAAVRSTSQSPTSLET